MRSCRHSKGIAELEKAVSAHLGYSDWLTITQEQITLFADATGDHQWIHVDPERAAAGPFGSTVAHDRPRSFIPPVRGLCGRGGRLEIAVGPTRRARRRCAVR